MTWHTVILSLSWTRKERRTNVKSPLLNSAREGLRSGPNGRVEQLALSGSVCLTAPPSLACRAWGPIQTAISSWAENTRPRANRIRLLPRRCWERGSPSGQAGPGEVSPSSLPIGCCPGCITTAHPSHNGTARLNSYYWAMSDGQQRTIDVVIPREHRSGHDLGAFAEGNVTNGSSSTSKWTMWQKC